MRASEGGLVPVDRLLRFESGLLAQFQQTRNRAFIQVHAVRVDVEIDVLLADRLGVLGVVVPHPSTPEVRGAAW